MCIYQIYQLFAEESEALVNASRICFYRAATFRFSCGHVKSRCKLIESMMGLRLRQGNLRLVFRLFSLMRGLPSI